MDNDSQQQSLDALKAVLREMAIQSQPQSWDVVVGGLNNSAGDDIMKERCLLDLIHNSSNNPISITLCDYTMQKYSDQIAPGACVPLYGMPFSHLRITEFTVDGAAAGLNYISMHGRLKAV